MLNPLADFVSHMRHIKAVVGVGAKEKVKLQRPSKAPRILHALPDRDHETSSHSSCVLKRKPSALFDNTSAAETRNAAKCLTSEAYCVVSDVRVVSNVLVVRGSVVFLEVGKVCLHGESKEPGAQPVCVCWWTDMWAKHAT